MITSGLFEELGRTHSLSVAVCYSLNLAQPDRATTVMLGGLWAVCSHFSTRDIPLS